jgi:hypothetical protein
MLLGLLHVALVAPHYHVGSFDDDASYILTAKALLAGHGLNGTVTSGQTISGLYPPGYPALLVPLLWLWPHTFAPMRLLSVLCFAALFPLTWTYLRRRGVSPGLRTATLVVLALGPPLATFASMVMAETPFLVVLMVLLLLVDRWDGEHRAWTWTAVGVVVTAAGLIWLKQAGIGLVLGLLVWLALNPRPQRRRRVFTVGVGVGALLSPVLIARIVAGVPLAGAKYSSELGTYYHGGLASRVVHVLPHSTWHLLSTAIPATLVPYLEPLPLTRHWSDLWIRLSWQVTILAAVGAVVWFRRYRDAALAMVVVYLAQSVLWPQVNERRAILVVPILAAWYVIGAYSAYRAVVAGVVGAGRADRAAAQATAAGRAAAAPLPNPPPADSVAPGAATPVSVMSAETTSPSASDAPGLAVGGAGSGMAARAEAPFSGADRRRRSSADPDPGPSRGWLRRRLSADPDPGTSHARLRRRSSADPDPGTSRAWLRRRSSADPDPGTHRLLGVLAAVLVLAVVVGPLVAQMPRDYLFPWGQSSSQFEGSRYVAMLSALGAPSDVVETDYMSTTALFTGHRTANTAFVNEMNQCDDSVATGALAGDNAGYLLLGDVNKPGLMDNPCLLGQAATNPWAVPLLHTARDNAFVFELVGPGTGHPELTDLNAGVRPLNLTSAAGSTMEYDWPVPRTIQQVSVGEAAFVGTPTTSVEIDLRTTAGRWMRVAGAASAVGDGRGDTPYLLATLANGTTATGMRIVVSGTQPEASASVSDAAALGLSAPTT